MDTVAEAQGYDAMDHCRPNTAFVDRLIELGARGCMLDLGAGPGRIALMLAERLPECEVVGVDLSREMLRLAQQHRQVSAAADRVRFTWGDVKQLHFADGAFDTVFSNTIAHHLADPKAMLAEAVRVLRPGGVLLIRDLFRPDDTKTVEALVREYAAEDGPEQQQMLRASLHAALTPMEWRSMAAELEITGLEIVIDTNRHLSLQTCAAGGAPDNNR